MFNFKGPMIPYACLTFPFCSISTRQCLWTKHIHSNPSARNAIVEVQPTWRFVAFLFDDVETRALGTRRLIRDTYSSDDGIERKRAGE